MTLDGTEPDLSWYRERCHYYSSQHDRDVSTIQGLSQDLDRSLSSIRALTATVEELQQAIRKVDA